MRICGPKLSLCGLIISVWGIIQLKPGLTENEEWSQRFARHLDPRDEDEESLPSPLEDLGQEYKVNSSHELQGLYSVLLQPFIDVYVTTTLNLHRLEDRQVPEKELTDDILKDIRTRLETGELSFNESASVDTIRNVLKLLEKWEVVECHSQDRIKLYYLGREYEQEDSGADSPLAPVVERIRQFQ